MNENKVKESYLCIFFTNKFIDVLTLSLIAFCVAQELHYNCPFSIDAFGIDPQ